MNTQIRIRGFNANDELRQRLEQSLEGLASSIAVSAAAVVLEYEQDRAPAYRAFVQLAVPGPDIHAEARGHTLVAVWLKVTNSLHRQIHQRKNQQEARAKSKRQMPISSRRTRSLAGPRV